MNATNKSLTEKQKLTYTEEEINSVEHSSLEWCILGTNFADYCLFSPFLKWNYHLKILTRIIMLIRERSPRYTHNTIYIQRMNILVYIYADVFLLRCTFFFFLGGAAVLGSLLLWVTFSLVVARRGYFLVVVQGLLTKVASLAAEHRF